jgi:hypothetical protein
MNEKLRVRLDLIDQWLLDEDIGKDLGIILSAVRGPDKEFSDFQKNNYTNPIRREAFPRTFKAALGYHLTGSASCWYVRDTAEVYRSERPEKDENRSHYEVHVHAAALALGIYKPNDEKE